jgi:uncharacterized protein (TIGR02145 family)
MKENLITITYKDNTPITNITADSLWMRDIAGAYCWYDNDESSNKDSYGALYNWYAVQTGKLCPDGWHMPTQAEWTTLTVFLGGPATAGGKMKETGLVHWDFPNTNASNESGFTGRAGGVRKPEFSNLRKTGSFWSISLSGSEPLSYSMSYEKVLLESTGYPQFWGFSVRCIKD